MSQPSRAATADCAVPGCGRVVAGRGLCKLHHQRLTRALPLRAAHEQVGQPSGFGMFGIVLRDDDGVMCFECGRWFRMLVQHLRQRHGLTVADYRQRHGLPAQTPLTSLSTSRTISQQSAGRIGSDSWAAFERARDEDGAHDRAVAASAAKAHTNRPAAGAAATWADTLRAHHARTPRTPRLCTICSDPIPTGREHRHQNTCSTECFRASKKRAANHRAAQAAGEPLDFERRSGSGQRWTISDIAARTGRAPATWQRWVRAGRVPPHDGRVDGARWWWESTVRASPIVRPLLAAEK